ncbi:MAG TPA: hypothetical protein VF335_06050 [Chitinivibrionales bacterium]
MRKHSLTMFFKSGIVLVFSVFAAVASVDTTAGKSAFQFLEAPTTPASVAMGNAATALPGAGFSYYNPARPYLSDSASLSVGYGPLPGDLSAWFGEGKLTFSNMFLAMHLSNHSIRNIYNATEQGPNYSVPFSSGFTLVSIDAGLAYNRGALALSVNGMQDRIDVYTAYGVSVSVGGIYRLIPEKLTLGAALLNIGTTTGYTDATSNWGEGDRLPRTGRIGAAYTDVVKQVPITVACDVVYRDVGDKLLAAKGALPRITVPLGVEVWPTEYVAARIGKRFNFETELINCGAGLRLGPLSFDLSIVLAKLVTGADIEVQPLFAVTYAPGSGGGKARPVVIAPETRVISGDTASLPLVKEAPAPKIDTAAVDSSIITHKPADAAADSTGLQPDAPDSSKPKPGNELPATPRIDLNKQQETVDFPGADTAPKK